MDSEGVENIDISFFTQKTILRPAVHYTNQFFSRRLLLIKGSFFWKRWIPAHFSMNMDIVFLAAGAGR